MSEQAFTTDYNEVVGEIAEEILGKLMYDEDGTVIDTFKTGRFDPWQLFLFYGVTEKVLTEWRTDKRCKSVIVYAVPEGLAGAPTAVTPARTLLQHVAYRRIDDVKAERLTFGEISFDGEELSYSGQADMKNRHVTILCDISDGDAHYLEECIAFCRDMKASRVLALPIMAWAPDEVSDDETPVISE